MDSSTKITNTNAPASVTTSKGTKTEDGNTCIDIGSPDQQPKEKRRKRRRPDGNRNRDRVRTDGRSRSRKDSKSRRYYSDNDGDSSDGDSSSYRRSRKKRKKKKAQKEKRRFKRKDRDRRKRRKRRRSYSSSSSSSSSSSISDDASISSYSSSSAASDRKRKKKRRRSKSRKRHEKDIDHAKIEKQSLCNEQEEPKATITVTSALSSGNSAKPAMPEEPIIEPKRKAMIPMSKEEYDKEQSKIREVYDPLSGRVRLVRGNGEIIERIVSSATHRQINSLATSGDGYAFSRGIYDKLNR